MYINHCRVLVPSEQNPPGKTLPATTEGNLGLWTILKVKHWSSGFVHTLFWSENYSNHWDLTFTSFLLS